MKTRLFVVVLMVAVVGFGACKRNKEKDPDNTITKFEVNGVSYQIQANGDITHTYDKVPAGGAWTGLPTGKVKPTITYAKKASINPSADTELDFGKLPAGEGSANLQTYTVKAENGETKSYTVKVTKGGL